MYNEVLSEPQLYAKNLIQRVGCISFQELDYILGHKFSTTTGQNNNVMHSLEQFFYVTCSKDNKYVTWGWRDDKFKNELDIDTIIALQVIMNAVGGDNIVEVVDTIYRPFDGGTLRFYFQGTAFEVYVARLENASYIRYLDDRGKDIYMHDKKTCGDARALELASKLLIIFPAEVNKKEALKLLDGLKIFMPHEVAFIKGSQYFEKQPVEYLGL